MSIKKKERFNFYSHLSGVLLAVFGMIFLMIHVFQTGEKRFVAIVYSLSTIMLFTASTLYHAFKRSENEISFWRKFDKFSIFTMIAGTYTPLIYTFLTGGMKWSIMIAQWSLVFLGLMIQVFFPNAPRLFYSVIYLLMGWMVVVPIKQFFNGMPALEWSLLIVGGVFYTIGAFVYAFKRPVFWPGVFGFHELFHIMVLLGASVHFVCIFGKV